MQVWSITNQKGGVGKTTTTVSLAGQQALTGKRTLLIDLDPHGSLTTYFGLDKKQTNNNVYKLFSEENINRKELVQLIYPTGIDRLFVMPSSLDMASLDRKFGNLEGKGLIISRTMKLLDGVFDQIFIDCPPILGVLMINALAACDHLIVPVQTEFLAVKGLERMQATISRIEQSRGFKLNYTIVPTMYDKRTRASVSSWNWLQNNYEQVVWRDWIPDDTRIRDASASKKPISHFDYNARGAHAYRRLSHDVIEAPGVPRPHYGVKP